MANINLHKEVLLDHYRHPRNKGDVSDADIIRRGSNPQCGDEVEVGVDIDGDKLTRVRFRGRGCSICLASASMMTESVSGKKCHEVLHLCKQIRCWVTDQKDVDRADIDETLWPLAAVRQHRARHQCVLLAWEALGAALDTTT